VRLRFLPLTLLLLLAPAFAQTLPQPTMAIVSGTLVLPPGTPAANTIVRFQLVYCGGNNGRVTNPDGSVTIVSYVPFDLRTSNGLWQTNLYGSDQIMCGSQKGTSRWKVTPIFNGQSGTALEYQVQSCGATTGCPVFDLDAAPQCQGTIAINCVVQYPYVIPPPPPIQGPPGEQGPPGPPGPPGSGGGANPGLRTQVGYYAADGSLLSGDANFTDDPTAVPPLLSYQGNSYLSGNQTIDNTLFLAGAYYMDTPSSVSAMPTAPVGRSAMGISTDGNFYASENSATPSRICTHDNAQCGGAPAGSNTQLQFNLAGALEADSNLSWDNTNKTLQVGPVTARTNAHNGVPSVIIQEQAGFNPLEIHTAHQTGIDLYSHDVTSQLRAPAISFMRSRGTQVSPAVVISGDLLGVINVGAYDGTTYPTSALVNWVATENWAVGARGTGFNLVTVQNGTTTTKNAITGNNDGSVSLPQLTGSTQCLHVDSFGKISGTGSDCPGGGGAGVSTALENCSPDQTGNSFYNVTSLTNYFYGSWQFKFNTTTYVTCTVFIPSAIAGATISVDVAANDGTAGHTANIQTCDGIVNTGTINIGALTCAANQTFTTTSTAYNRVVLTFNVQSTLVNNSTLVIKIATSPSGTAPTANLLVYPHFIL